MPHSARDDTMRALTDKSRADYHQAFAIMKIHEYQAKAILARHGVPVPRGEVTFNAAEAREIAQRLGGGVVVVKAQIHAGGRGKGGGVKLAQVAATRPRRSRSDDDRHDARHAPDRPRRPRRRRAC